ncbi:hypothetical protein P7C70_g5711, partial [Phenoliferia sp. Uapishka_3]
MRNSLFLSPIQDLPTPGAPIRAQDTGPTASGSVTRSSRPLANYSAESQYGPAPLTTRENSATRKSRKTFFPSRALDPSPKVLKCLRNDFKISVFWSKQLEIIDATLEGRDVFVTMPTAAGKSLPFQLPAVILAREGRGVTLVISPLKSLIADQAGRMGQLDLSVQALVGGVKLDVSEGLDLIYTTPEKLFGEFDRFQQLYQEGKLARFVIDEAHYRLSCHGTFRKPSPAYQELSRLRQSFPSTPIAAFTASIAPRDRDNLIAEWGIKPVIVTAGTFNRPNIDYEVTMKKGDGIDQLKAFAKEHRGERGIVYVASAARGNKVVTALRRASHAVELYHGGNDMTDNNRDRALREWGEGKFSVMVGTTALGLGINIGAIRWVFHYDPPHSLADYYQESSRAGRDGSFAKSLVLFSYAGVDKVANIIHQNKTPPRVQEDFQRLILALVSTCCRRTLILAAFGEDFDATKCGGTCDNCRRGTLVEGSDVTLISKDVINLVDAACKRSVRVTSRQLSDQLRSLAPRNLTAKMKWAKLTISPCENTLLYNDFDIRSLLVDLQARGLLELKCENSTGYRQHYLTTGPKAHALLLADFASFEVRMVLKFPTKTKRKPKPQESDGQSLRKKACAKEVDANKVLRIISHDCHEELDKLLPDEPRLRSHVSQHLPAVARRLPVDADELGDKIFQGAKLEPFCTWFISSGAQTIVQAFAKKATALEIEFNHEAASPSEKELSANACTSVNTSSTAHPSNPDISKLTKRLRSPSEWTDEEEYEDNSEALVARKDTSDGDGEDKDDHGVIVASPHPTLSSVAKAKAPAKPVSGSLKAKSWNENNGCQKADSSFCSSTSNIAGATSSHESAAPSPNSSGDPSLPSLSPFARAASETEGSFTAYTTPPSTQSSTPDPSLPKPAIPRFGERESPRLSKELRNSSSTTESFTSRQLDLPQLRPRSTLRPSRSPVLGHISQPNANKSSPQKRQATSDSESEFSDGEGAHEAKATSKTRHTAVHGRSKKRVKYEVRTSSSSRTPTPSQDSRAPSPSPPAPSTFGFVLSFTSTA